MAQLMASSDHLDARSMEQRENSVENKSTVLNASRKPGCGEKNGVNNMACEFNANTSCSILGKTSYLSALELNLRKENVSSSTSEATAPVQKEQNKDSILPKDETEKDGTSLNTNADLPLFSDSDIDEDKYSDLGDDYQTEYHSAEDEGCVCHGKQETKNSETCQDKNLAKEDQHTDGQQCFNKLENMPSTPVSNTPGNNFSSISELPCTFGDGKGRDERTGSFYTVTEELFNTKANKEKDPDLFSTSKVVIDDKVIAESLTDITRMPTRDTKRNSCEQTDYSSTCVFDETGDSCSAVTQAVDASSDFRACFTTSRAINVKVPVMSRGQNTVITMMSKFRSKEWLTVNHRSVACNTDWSCVSGSVDMADSQKAFKNYATKYGCQSKNKNLFECRNSTMKDFDEIPGSSSSLERMQHSQEIVRHSPNCCNEIFREAMETEVQLLKIHYQMHHQDCFQTCNSVLEEKEHVSSSYGSGTSESLIWPQNVETSSHPLMLLLKKKKLATIPSLIPPPSIPEILQNVMWLQGYKDRIAYIQEKAQIHYYDYGDVISDEGDLPKGIHIIISGMVKTCFIDVDDLLEAFDIFLEQPCLEDKIWLKIGLDVAVKILTETFTNQSPGEMSWQGLALRSQWRSI